MDPDANLAAQRRIVQEITTLIDGSDAAFFSPSLCQQLAGLAAELSELAHALDAWITGGGFLPAQWTVAQKPNATR